MKTEPAARGNQMKFRFIGLYLFSIVLIIFIITAFRDKTSSSAVTKAAVPATNPANQQLLAAHDLLQNRFATLLQLDDAYKTAETTDKELIKNNIVTEETRFNTTLDSLAQTKEKLATSDAKQHLDETITFFRSSLHSYQALNELRNTANTQTTQPVATVDNSEQIKQLQTDIADKQAKIDDLQNQLAAAQKKAATVAAPTSANSSDLAVRNERLRSGLSTMENRNAVLTRQINELKRDNERLMSQLNAMLRSKN